MRCPKCNHEQKVSLECEACGIIFEKYRLVQERKKEHADREATQQEKSGGGLKLMQVILLVIVVAGGTYYFTVGKNQLKEPAVAVTQPVPAVIKEKQKNVETRSVQVKSTQDRGTTQQIATKHSAVARARNATVSIETPWGTGSGFFINKEYIVTNRHVIEFDEAKLADFKDKVETARRMIDLEKQKIKKWRRELRRMTDSSSRKQLAIIIEKSEEELRKVLPRQEKGERRLEKLEGNLQPSDIKIYLADGSEHEANYLLKSDTHDLALMSLYVGESSYLERAPKVLRINQGDKVYTIGSPVGLRHTVTAGIFSGYRQQKSDGQMYLQTDAAINPGNSGGPLIDEYGYVRGVNTMILRDTEGIGFAIPIDAVFEEFSSTLF